MSASIERIAAAAREASRVTTTLGTEVKNEVLRALAAGITERSGALLSANARDLAEAEASGLPGAKLKRLALTEGGLEQMAAGLRQIVELPDPVGQATREYTVPSGLRVRRVRCPLGVIMMIYEARPNVTIDAFALCFKAGNACLLKGGREAAHSNQALADCAREVLTAHQVPAETLQHIATSDRESIRALLGFDQYIDLVIPRGGAELIRFVHEHSRIPTVQHFHGVCHIFVDASADAANAIEVCTTAKTSAPATCNAAECILIHQDLAGSFVPLLAKRFGEHGVQVRGDQQVCALSSAAVPADDGDWGREFLDLIVAVKIVPDLESAVQHINQYGSNHTDVILTNDRRQAEQFTQQVQSSCTLVNASTRFNDGFQLGLGAEIGISTSRIHAYGPMGLEELTTQRFIVQGDWHTR